MSSRALSPRSSGNEMTPRTPRTPRTPHTARSSSGGGGGGGGGGKRGKKKRREAKRREQKRQARLARLKAEQERREMIYRQQELQQQSSRAQELGLKQNLGRDNPDAQAQIIPGMSFMGTTVSMEHLDDIHANEMLIVRNVLHHLPKGDSADPRESELGRRVVVSKLTSGGVFKKFGRRGAPKYRTVWVNKKLDKVYWGEVKNGIKKPSGWIMVKDVKAIVQGHETAVFKKQTKKSAGAELCFSFLTHDRSLDLEAPSTSDKDLWVLAFNTLLKYYRSEQFAKTAAELSGSDTEGVGSGTGTGTDTDDAKDGATSPNSTDIDRRNMSAITLADEVAMLRMKLKNSVTIEEANRMATESAELAMLRAKAKYLEEENQGLADLPEQIQVLKRENKKLKRPLNETERELDRVEEMLLKKHAELERFRRQTHKIHMRDMRRAKVVEECLDDTDDEEEYPGMRSVLPWTHFQRKLLDREQKVIAHFFPRAKWIYKNTQHAELLVPVAAPSGALYEMKVRLRGFPTRMPELLLTKPENPVDSDGVLLSSLGTGGEWNVSGWIDGHPQIDYLLVEEKMSKHSADQVAPEFRDAGTNLNKMRVQRFGSDFARCPSLYHIVTLAVAWVRLFDATKPPVHMRPMITPRAAPAVIAEQLA